MIKLAVSSKPKSERMSVEPEVVRIGKDVIELLTSGMYVSPITIFREYVQNAADAIDAYCAGRKPTAIHQGLVAITIDNAARTVSIRDNGAALPSADAAQTLLAIGSSPKRGTSARGFRGVGRLSGLAYCRELVFKSKAAKEKEICCVSWNCRELRRRLADTSSKDDLKSIITSSVEVWYEAAGDPAEHFFEVQMHDVARHRQDLLLNEIMIADYLGQVAPLSFSPDFSFAPSIEQKLADAGVARNHIALSINGEQIYRPFQDVMTISGASDPISFQDIEFIEFADTDGNLGAVGWVAHHEYVRCIPPNLGIRGLRARVGDVQVGEANLFDSIFRESRFNGWTVGEVHIVDRRVVPNGRRDDFEVNHHTYNLLAQLAPVAGRLASRARTASIGRNAEQTIRNAIDDAERRLQARTSLDSVDLSRMRGALERARGKLKAIPDISMRETLEQEISHMLSRLARRKPKGPPAVALDEAKLLVSKIITNREQARTLLSQLDRLCARRSAT